MMMNIGIIQDLVRGQVNRGAETYTLFSSIANYGNSLAPSNNWQMLSNTDIRSFVCQLEEWVKKAYISSLENDSNKGLFFGLEDAQLSGGLVGQELFAFSSQEYYTDIENEWREESEVIDGLGPSKNKAFLWIAEKIEELNDLDSSIDYALPFAFAISAVHEVTKYMIRGKTIKIPRKLGVAVGYRWGDSINLGYLSDRGFTGGAGLFI